MSWNEKLKPPQLGSIVNDVPLNIYFHDFSVEKLLNQVCKTKQVSPRKWPKLKPRILILAQLRIGYHLSAQMEETH